MRTLARLHGKFYQTKDEDVLKLSLWGEGAFRLKSWRALDFGQALNFTTNCATSRQQPRTDGRTLSLLFQKSSTVSCYCPGLSGSLSTGVEEEIWPLTVLSYQRNNILPQCLVHSDVYVDCYLPIGFDSLLAISETGSRLMKERWGFKIINVHVLGTLQALRLTFDAARTGNLGSRCCLVRPLTGILSTLSVIAAS
jgi:hypothetical protein